jgi:hypothetical protein
MLRAEARLVKCVPQFQAVERGTKVAISAVPPGFSNALSGDGAPLQTQEVLPYS